MSETIAVFGAVKRGLRAGGSRKSEVFKKGYGTNYHFLLDRLLVLVNQFEVRCSNDHMQVQPNAYL